MALPRYANKSALYRSGGNRNYPRWENPWKEKKKVSYGMGDLRELEGKTAAWEKMYRDREETRQKVEAELARQREFNEYRQRMERYNALAQAQKNTLVSGGTLTREGGYTPPTYQPGKATGAQADREMRAEQIQRGTQFRMEEQRRREAEARMGGKDRNYRFYQGEWNRMNNLMERGPIRNPVEVRRQDWLKKNIVRPRPGGGPYDNPRVWQEEQRLEQMRRWWEWQTRQYLMGLGQDQEPPQGDLGYGGYGGYGGGYGYPAYSGGGGYGGGYSTQSRSNLPRGQQTYAPGQDWLYQLISWTI